VVDQKPTAAVATPSAAEEKHAAKPKLAASPSEHAKDDAKEHAEHRKHARPAHQRAARTTHKHAATSICMHFRSYDADTGTYVGYDHRKHACR